MTEEGVVTLMFTDVEGSTGLATAHGDAEAQRILNLQRQVVRAELSNHGGREIDSIGDGFMLSFSSTRRAVACAIAIQRALEDKPVKVRIGLNVGEVIDSSGHPFGGAVNAAARVAGNAKGGEILVADAVKQLAGTMPGVAFRDRGRVRLKGFPEPWRLYEVLWRDGAAGTRRLRRYVVGALAAIAATAATVSAVLLLTGGSTGASAGAHAPRNDPPTIVPGESIGGIAIGMTEDEVKANYGEPAASGSWAGLGKTGTYATYSLHGGTLDVSYFDGKVVAVSAGSPYYRSDDGIALGILAPTYPDLLRGEREWKGFRYKCFSYRASGGEAETELGLVIPLGGPKQHSRIADITVTRRDFLTDAKEPPEGTPFVGKSC